MLTVTEMAKSRARSGIKADIFLSTEAKIKYFYLCDSGRVTRK
jgi:hypothetical protein